MRILLIEDDKFFQDFYAFKLKEKSMEVEVASDGEEGLAKLSQNKPDLILLDLIMPKMDGFKVLEKMAQDNLLDNIPVLVFSTLGQEEDIDKVMKLGAKGYVNKSVFDFDKLFNQIMQLINK